MHAQVQQSKQLEIAACLASVERMIERLKLLVEEFDRKIIKSGYRGPPVESLDHAITFSELRSLDLLCKDALERALPEYPNYSANWYVNRDKELGSPGEAHSQFLQKKQVLVALSILDNESLVKQE